MGWEDDHFCFACGNKNHDGLKLHFHEKDGKLFTEYAFPKKFQGYAGVVHGGMISLVLDEVTVNLPWRMYDTPVVTAELTVRLKKPALIGQKIIFSSWIEKEVKNLISVKGEAVLENGEVIATASVKCFKVKLEDVEEKIKDRGL